jgi:hypothetical protein
MTRTGTLLAVAMTAGTWAAADTLVLRNGDRIEGRLVEVRGDRIEFEEDSGWSSRTRRYDRDEVRAIELDDGYGSSYDDRDSRPSGLRERGVRVEAKLPWNDTGIDVERGQDIFIDASGKVRWGPNRRHGPKGEGGKHTNPNRPIPNRPGGSLIGRIGNDYFFIGDDEGPFRMRDDGRLYLGVNDDYLQDNSGYFSVTVYY